MIHKDRKISQKPFPAKTLIGTNNFIFAIRGKKFLFVQTGNTLGVKNHMQRLNKFLTGV